MSIDRLQGTDGIRRPVALSGDPRVAGLTPQEAFCERGLITEEFLELYAFACASNLAGPGDIVVGWDPRDPEGVFTGAVVRGVRKASRTAVVAGICPTPAVALYLVWSGAAASFMVTASHNFRDQNGVKIFRGPGALKLFPDDDRALTRQVLALDYRSDVKTRPATGGEIDVSREARRLFCDFHLDPRNSWLPEGETLGDFPLVVDAANGAMSGVAASVFRNLHGGEVIEVNHDTGSGEVNRKSGVADLEGVAEIARDDLRFGGHRAIQEVFERRGKAAVFDADGDRFYRLDYDGGSDTILVLSGDETAVHQARHLAPPEPGTIYVNTVESDLNAARAAQQLGYTAVLTAVGDKWVLQEAARHPERYGIGSEETGHNISRGLVVTRAGEERIVFLGNGLKSALNTFVATRGLSPREAHRPFVPGFKRTFYVYYTQKERLVPESDVFRGVAGVIEEACALGRAEAQPRQEEPEMLYLAVADREGRQRAGIFVRNSGTEEKTGVNVRGACEDAEVLSRVGEKALLYLAAHMKNWGHPMANAQREVLRALSAGPLAAEALPIPSAFKERLIEEMANKERVIRACPGGYERTALGTRMLEAWS